MRLPRDKVYRAFPELDRFPDEECRRFVRFAKKNFRRSAAWHVVLAPLFAFGCLVLYVIIMSILGELFGSLPIEWVPWGIMLTGLIIAGGAASILVPPLVLRDRWLRRALRIQLLQSRCLSCQYSLLGLPVENGAVRCPECGEQTTLADRGLTPDQLLVPR